MRPDIKVWNPENPAQWNKTLAWTTVWLSTFSLTLGFCAWFLVPSLAPRLNEIGFSLTHSQLYWLVAMVGLSAGTLRILWTFLPPILGTRILVTLSTGLLLIPLFCWVYAAQHPDTPYWMLICFALLSGIGGGTLGGLCHKLVGMERFGQIKKLAESGNLDHVDLTMKDITVHSAPTLDPDMTAANFGDLAEDATPADLAAGVVNLVLQAIGTMTVLACQCCDSKTVVLTGSMTTLPQAVTNFQLFEKLYGIHYIIPENATFATAIGAGLYSLQKKPEA